MLPSLGYQSQELEFRLLEMLCVPPETKTSHRAPLGPCFSADSVPAGLWLHCSNWSLGSCIIWWGPGSETASLHLPYPSPSSHLLRGNICHSTWGQVQKLLQTSGELLAAQLPRGELSGDASSTQSCSFLMGHVSCWRSAALFLNIPPLCMRSLGSPRANPSKP